VASENLDLVRSIYAEWERGDWSSTWWADPAIELVLEDGVTRDVHAGPAEVAKGWRNFLSAWEDLRVVVEEYRELDANRVLVLIHNEGRGKRSGVDIGTAAAKTANLLEIRNGKVARITTYWDRERAFADLGL
jgi:ketosteroid isomerase-like protein